MESVASSWALSSFGRAVLKLEERSSDKRRCSKLETSCCMTFEVDRCLVGEAFSAIMAASRCILVTLAIERSGASRKYLRATSEAHLANNCIMARSMPKTARNCAPYIPEATYRIVVRF